MATAVDGLGSIFVASPTGVAAGAGELIKTEAADEAYQIAEIYAWRGEKDQAFMWLDRAYAQHDGGLIEVKADKLLASLRADARYAAFLRKMNLPE